MDYVKDIVYKAEDRRISIALMSPYVILTFQYFLIASLNLFGTLWLVRIQFFSKMLVGLIFAYAFPIVWKRQKIRIMGLYFFWIIEFLTHYLFFPDNRNALHDIIFYLFFMCIPALVYSRSLKDWSLFKKVIDHSSLIVFWLCFVLALLVISGTAFIGTYSMPLAYYALLPATIFVNEWFTHITLKNGFFGLTSILIILALGSRGPIFCLGVFVILRMLKPTRRYKLKEIFSYLFIMLALIICLLFFKEILILIDNYLLLLGIKSRSITLFLRPKIFLSGRDKLYHVVIRDLLKHPLVGLGLAGDRLLVGGYVHNFFIEVLAHFGVVMGSILLVWFMVRLIMSVKNNTKHIHKYEMIIIWIALGLAPLMVSSSYLININFWILLGLMSRDS